MCKLLFVVVYGWTAVEANVTKITVISKRWMALFWCPKDTMWIWDLIGVVALVLVGGITSGLSVGLMTLDETHLGILQRSGTFEQKTYATRILPIRKDGYLLLCTLLVINSIVNETLPILINRLVSDGWQAILISTFLVLVFAEIVPQAFFTRFGLSASARLVWLVRLLIWITYPVAYPLSRFIHSILGDTRGVVYRRKDIKELVELLKGTHLTVEEAGIVGGVLELIDKEVETVIKPLADVFMLDVNTLVDQNLVDQVLNKGHSRIPLYNGNPTHVVAILKTRHLISNKLKVGHPLRDLKLLEPCLVRRRLGLCRLLATLKKERLVIVTDERDRAIGMATLKDIVALILQQEVSDIDEKRHETPLISIHFQPLDNDISCDESPYEPLLSEIK